MPSVQYRHVCFTTFEVSSPPTWDESLCSYLIFGRETCPTSGRIHYQGYCEFRKRVTLNTVRELFHGAHIERRNGSADQAASYCRKENDWTEYGVISQQGQRSDLHSTAERLASGRATLSDIAASNPGLFVQYGRGLSLLRSFTSQARTRKYVKIDVTVIWGRTGTGKSRSWWESKGYDSGFSFEYAENGQWWDGYDGEKHVLFDEFACQIPLSTLLKWTDGYPLKLWVKGSFTYANYESVTFISNDNPQGWYSNCSDDKRDAFARRVTRVVNYTGNEKIETQGFSFTPRAPCEFITADKSC